MDLLTPSSLVVFAVIGVLAVAWYPILFTTYITFIFSAIALSDVIMTMCIPVLLVSRNLFRKITNSISHYGWPLITLAFEALGRNKLVFTGEDIVLHQSHNNGSDRNALVLINHTYHCDWLLAFSLGERTGRIGNIKIAMKSVIKYIPFVGVGIWAMGFIFLSRKWQDDRHKIARAYSHLKNDGEPFWFVTHPEGSRFNEKNLQASQEFAKSRPQEVPLLKNILVPRVKGFSSAVISMKGAVDAVYDLTVAYKRHPASFFALFYGNKPTEIHIHLRRFPIASVPVDQGDHEIGNWLYQRYTEKDELLQHFKDKGHFPGQSLAHLNRFNWRKYIVNLVCCFMVAVSMATPGLYGIANTMDHSYMVTFGIFVGEKFGPLLELGQYTPQNDSETSCVVDDIFYHFELDSFPFMIGVQSLSGSHGFVISYSDGTNQGILYQSDLHHQYWGSANDAVGGVVYVFSMDLSSDNAIVTRFSMVAKVAQTSVLPSTFASLTGAVFGADGNINGIAFNFNDLEIDLFQYAPQQSQLTIYSHIYHLAPGIEILNKLGLQSSMSGTSLTTRLWVGKPEEDTLLVTYDIISGTPSTVSLQNIVVSFNYV
ncbi:Putative acetyltransferase protein [Cavenderia fasciculata]|uniref:Acetyltransferase protein n=1 Tax=Cavenderia fasciculata TaxID=261658 RepID=F4PZS9_CACFS|nr:Putative acetyltransferase protein [Cavenderia fasciculata]EGG18843.1 Putative acetyltransferase protein [Cavenderia fasciculata]|eukprot:XP_004357305.1 Putative acetyltransferase protein [Cavenderia fasciculata]